MNLKAIAIAVLILSAALTLGATENTGPQHIDINTGKNGWVPFPHREHQNNLVDCTICHQHFPKEEQGILRLKKEGQLKPKQIMTTVCIQCHKDRRAQGMKAGPTGCARCHTKR